MKRTHENEALPRLRRAPWPVQDLMRPILSLLSELEQHQVGWVSRYVHQVTTTLRSRTLVQRLQHLLGTLGTPLPSPWPSGVYLSGSVLWKTLVPGNWLPNDVDLFMPNDPAVIQATQRWLVEAGYRIRNAVYMREYGSVNVAGIVSWARPLDPAQKVERLDQSRTFSVRHLQLLEDVRWLPGITAGHGLIVEMIVANTAGRRDDEAERAFRSRVIHFDLPALENTWNGRELHVKHPREVLNRTTRVEPVLDHAANWWRNRQLQRLKRYRDRGLQWERMCAPCKREMRDGSLCPGAPRCLCPPQ